MRRGWIAREGKGKRAGIYTFERVFTLKPLEAGGAIHVAGPGSGKPPIPGSEVSIRESLESDREDGGPRYG